MYNIDFILKVKLFVEIVESEIELKFKPRFSFPEKIILAGDNCYGLWNCDTKKGKHYHKIDIALSMVESDEMLFTTIAHEYVHCWQMECDLERDHDNESFLLWTEYFNLVYGVEL